VLLDQEIRAATDAGADAPLALDQLLALLPVRDPGAARLAHQRATSLAAADQDEGAHMGVLAALADVIAMHAADTFWAAEAVQEVVDEAAEETGSRRDVVATTLFLRATRDPRLLELSPFLAVSAQLRLFLALAPVTGVSLWAISPLENVRCVADLGEPASFRRTRMAARRALGLVAERESGRGALFGVPVLRWQRPHAALVVHARKDARELAQALAEESAAALAPVLDREALLTRNSTKERALVEASERRLTRVGMDIHDGPMQVLASVGVDLGSLRCEVTSLETDLQQSLLERLDRVQGRLAGVDRDLRELAQSLEPSSLIVLPLRDLLRREADSFETQADIPIELEVNGDLDGLTSSQRIALLRIVQETLSNIREHSGATRVAVVVGVRRGHVYAEIQDNGQGFDVERTLVRAAQKGRLGLVGMSERARLLGGRFDIVSKKGGPTTVSVVFPPWRPLGLPGAARARNGRRAAASRPA
jgi:signal transduction histidine kinase